MVLRFITFLRKRESPIQQNPAQQRMRASETERPSALVAFGIGEELVYNSKVLNPRAFMLPESWTGVRRKQLGVFLLPSKKTGRQQVKRARRNRSAKTETRTIVGRAYRSLAAGDAEAAQPQVTAAVKILDRAVRKGILHKNNAARRKSRMMARLSLLEQASEG